MTFSLLGLYLLGKIKFAHDSDMPYLGVGRLALAIVTFSLVVYLVPGMWGAPLKGLSGYLPPLHTQDFVIGQQDGSGPAPAGGEARMLLTVDGQKPKHSDFLHLPHNLEGFFDLKEAEAYAAKVGKPLFIDFTDTTPVKHFKSVVRNWFIHHHICKFQILFFRPEQHFLIFFYCYISSFLCRIRRQMIKINCMIENGT